MNKVRCVPCRGEKVCNSQRVANAIPSRLAAGAASTAGLLGLLYAALTAFFAELLSTGAAICSCER